MPFDAEPDVKVLYRDRMLRLRDFLAGLPPAAFNMGQWHGDDEVLAEPIHGCKTSACIGGWACDLFGLDYRRAEEDSGQLAALYLGLSPDQRRDLFIPHVVHPTMGYIDPEVITLPEAIETLDEFLATGEIDWSHVGRDA